MSRCSRCGYDHPGVGQSPEHPAEVSLWPVIFIFIFLILGIVILEIHS